LTSTTALVGRSIVTNRAEAFGATARPVRCGTPELAAVVAPVVPAAGVVVPLALLVAPVVPAAGVMVPVAAVVPPVPAAGVVVPLAVVAAPLVPVADVVVPLAAVVPPVVPAAGVVVPTIDAAWASEIRFTSVLEDVLMTDTSPLPWFATKTRPPSIVPLIAIGFVPTGIVAKTLNALAPLAAPVVEDVLEVVPALGVVVPLAPVVAPLVPAAGVVVPLAVVPEVVPVADVVVALAPVVPALGVVVPLAAVVAPLVPAALFVPMRTTLT
jgi:hypothetical protein